MDAVLPRFVVRRGNDTAFRGIAAPADNDDRLYPGMQAEVMILTGRNTLMSYLFEPLAQTIRRAFRET